MQKKFCHVKLVMINSHAEALFSSKVSLEIKETNHHIDELPFELHAKILSYLRLSDLSSVCSTDCRRNQIVTDSNLKWQFTYRDFAFNSRDWKRLCKTGVDTEGEKDSFPSNIYEELNKPCPVIPGKRIGQTHILTWIPKKVNGDYLTLNRFGIVLKEHFPIV